jgi:predicted O-methyltransferase YrrM
MIFDFPGKLLYMLMERSFQNLERSVISLNNYRELMKVYGWDQDPILDRSDIHDFNYIEDVNERRIRDAESLATVMRNVRPAAALEIGTAKGMSTVLMSVNSPETKIFTLNIPPEEIHAGKGGTLTTVALEREQIGIAYRERNLLNITQILANTATWEPRIGEIDVAFIDGCHDSEFVYNDTRKVLKHMKPGGFILWHDFNLDMMNKFGWIKSVCTGVEKLYADGLIKGRIFQVRDSWIGIYQITE